jgi:hypothetical protein
MEADMKKVAAILIILAMWPAALFAGGGSEEPVQKKILLEAHIEYVEGEVLHNGNPAVIGANIKGGDRFSTGSGALCEIIFNTHNIIRMQDETSMVFDPYDEESSIEVSKGSVLGVFDRLSQELTDSKSEMRVRTPINVAGIRGTAFFVKVFSENSAYFCTCNGTIQLGTAEDGAALDTEVQASRHYAYRYTRSGDEINARTAPLLYHDDADLDSAAEKIGVEINWSGGGGSY